jgi:hypothetical protein
VGDGRGMTLEESRLKFEMTGCRKSCEIIGNPERMSEMIDLIEQHIDDHPSLVFDACKSLIEFSCKNILQFTNNGFGSDWDLPKFIRETTKAIRLTPTDYDGDAIASPIFIKISSGIATVVQYMGELRSKEGLLAHGALGYSRQLSTAHARFVAASTDALIELLVHSSRTYWTNIDTGEGSYDDNSEFNEEFDVTATVTDDGEGYLVVSTSDGSETLRYRKSDLLYRLDKEQYLGLVKDYNPVSSDEDDI